MLVKDMMKKDVKVIRPDASVRKAAELMNRYRIGSLVVLSGDGKVVGLITERDILTDVVAEGRSSEDVSVGEIMTKDLITIDPETHIEDAASIMNKNKIKKLPVISGGHLVGIVTASDLITYEGSLIEKIAELLVREPRSAIGG